jgi:Arc/MetJ-type ribon-helix-helix transcriptional regulator
MTIHLPPDIENSIQAAIRSGHFASIDDAMTEAAALLLQRIKQIQPSAASPVEAAPKHKPIWEVAAELRRTVPPEEWAKLPVDGAAQHNHYIYGTPKRPTK